MGEISQKEGKKMAGAISGVQVGGEGSVRGPSNRVKGIRNHRSKTSPKALLAIKQKRLKAEQAKAQARRY